MWLTTLALLFALSSVIYLRLKQHYSYWTAMNVPHEQPKYFFGNMYGIGSKYHWIDIHERIYRRFKGKTTFAGFYTFFSRTALILDLDLIKHILTKDFANFCNRGGYHNVRDDPLSGNLLFLDFEQWRVLRQKLSPVFTASKMRFMFATMQTIAERLVETCHNTLVVHAGQIETKDLCARYATDVIGTCAFGIECNSLRDHNSKFRYMGRKVIEEPHHSLAVQAFMFTNVKLARALRMKQFSTEVSDFFMKAVRDTIEYRTKNSIKCADFMDLLIELRTQRDQLDMNAATVDDLSNGLTMEQVAAQAFVFFLAGFDTSSSTMATCLYELALNVDIQEQLRQEIFRVLAKYNGVLTYDSVKDMFYLKQVISETLRKYPVVPQLVRETVNDYRIPGSNIVFKRGLMITIPVAAIHHDSAYYPMPEKFDPARFSPERIAERHAFAYLPFGDGPRNCIGSRFGKLQTAIGIITLLRYFKFSTTTTTQIPLRFAKQNFMIAAESGIHLKVEKLEN